MRVLVSLLTLLLSTSLGCPIMDELNNANEEMDEFVRKGAPEEEELAAGQPQTVESRSKEWWGKAKSLDSRTLNPAIVSCRLRSGTQFMARDECLNRGGQPGNASG